MPTLHKPNNSSPVRWVPPQNGLYKVNIDGAVFWNFHLLNSYISCISFAKLKLSTLKGKATNQDMVVCTVCWWCNSYFSNMKWNKFRWGFLKKKKKKSLEKDLVQIIFGFVLTAWLRMASIQRWYTPQVEREHDSWLLTLTFGGHGYHFFN